MMHGKISGFHRTQEGLILLAKQPAFGAIFKAEVETRRVDPEQVSACVPTLYDSMSRYPRADNGPIVLKVSDYAVNELTALVVFLKLQSTWSGSGLLEWREEAEKDTQDDIAQDAMEKALGVGVIGGCEDGKKLTERVGMEEEAMKNGVEIAGAVGTLLAM